MNLQDHHCESWEELIQLGEGAAPILQLLRGRRHKLAIDRRNRDAVDDHWRHGLAGPEAPWPLSAAPDESP